MARSDAPGGRSSNAGKLLEPPRPDSKAADAAPEKPAPTAEGIDELAKENRDGLKLEGAALAQSDYKAAPAAPPALLFEPSLATDAQGQATIEFTLPDVDCEYRVLIDAIGHGRIGSLQQVIVGRGESDNN